MLCRRHAFILFQARPWKCQFNCLRDVLLLIRHTQSPTYSHCYICSLCGSIRDMKRPLLLLQAESSAIQLASRWNRYWPNRCRRQTVLVDSAETLNLFLNWIGACVSVYSKRTPFLQHTFLLADFSLLIPPLLFCRRYNGVFASCNILIWMYLVQSYIVFQTFVHVMLNLSFFLHTYIVSYTRFLSMVIFTIKLQRIFIRISNRAISTPSNNVTKHQ